MAEQKPLDEMAEWCAKAGKKLATKKSDDRYREGVIAGLAIVIERCRALSAASGRAPTNKEE